MAMSSLPDITVTTSAVDVFTKANVTGRKRATIRVNQMLNQYRPKVLEALTINEGILLRRNRSIQVKGILGVLKKDYGFRRFLTRGKRNIETQFFLLAFAFNVEKLCIRTKKEELASICSH